MYGLAVDLTPRRAEIGLWQNSRRQKPDAFVLEWWQLVWTRQWNLGQQFREDQPQGENNENVVQNLPELKVPKFVPIESRVVLPPADEPGQGETRDHGFVESMAPAGADYSPVKGDTPVAGDMDDFPPCPEPTAPAGLGMDLSLIHI